MLSLWAFLSAMVLSAASCPSRAELPSPTAEPITPVPAASRVDPRVAALGRALFGDPILSRNDRLSCSSCHDLSTNGASTARFDTGDDGHALRVNTPTVFNSVLDWRLDWHGDAGTLQDQAELSLRDPDLMGADPAAVVRRLRRSATYRRRFGVAFGRNPDWPGIVDAIAAFETTLVTPGGRFDRWLEGQKTALTPREVAGYTLFKSVGCTACHQGVNVGGNLFERQGVVDPTGVPSRDVFRVPSLRNVARTPPYFHDGSAATLPVAVHAMGTAQLGRDLPPEDVSLIVDFLRTLDGPVGAAARGDHP